MLKEAATAENAPSNSKKVYFLNGSSVQMTCVLCHDCSKQTTRSVSGTPGLTGKRLTSPVRHRRRMAPSCQPDRTDAGANRWREWDGRPGPTTAKRLRASERELLSRSLSPTPPLKNPPLNLFRKKKKSPNSIFYVCVCICVCLSVSLFFLFFSFLAWCQMFQLSTAVQHRWWWI